MALLDKLSQRGLKRMGKPTGTQPSPLPTIGETIQRPQLTGATPNVPVSPTTVGRVGQLPQAGAVGSLPQFKNIKKRFIADLPAKTQLQGIAQILSGQESTSPVLNNFVKGMAAKGAQPEDIRQAFINQQKTSENPLVIQ